MPFMLAKGAVWSRETDTVEPKRLREDERENAVCFAMLLLAAAACRPSFAEAPTQVT
jgi:hypothetical protein